MSILLVDYIKESLNEIDEAKVVSFKDKLGHKKQFNQCIILGGGPGIGKGFIRANYLDVDYKIFNVDTLKKLYVKMVDNGIIDDKKYNFKNKSDVGELHKKISDLGWKFKDREKMLNKDNVTNKDRLPNICFDITAKDPKAFEEIFDLVDGLGYEITFVWVVGNLDVAIANNEKRSRSVDSDLLRSIHAEVNDFIPKLLSNKYPEISKHIDRAFIALSAGIGRELAPRYKDVQVVELRKTDGANFNYDEMQEEIENFMHEIQPEKK